MRNAGEKAWIALLGNAAGYELIAPDGQMLSHAFSRFRLKHPILALVATVVTVAHLWEILPRVLDPYRIGLWHLARKLEQASAL